MRKCIHLTAYLIQNFTLVKMDRIFKALAQNLLLLILEHFELIFFSYIPYSSFTKIFGNCTSLYFHPSFIDVCETEVSPECDVNSRSNFILLRSGLNFKNPFFPPLTTQ
jgi:hypothetical protein